MLEYKRYQILNLNFINELDTEILDSKLKYISDFIFRQVQGKSVFLFEMKPTKNTEDIIHSIILVPVLHHSLTLDCQLGVLQPLTLLVKGIGGLGTVAQLLVNGVTALVVAYPFYYNALLTQFIACKANYLPCRM